MLAASRIVMVGESPHAHEQEALRFLEEHLPDHEPYRLWGLVEILDPPTGKLYELDALVLGYSALYLVEIKSGPGRYQGDNVDWHRTPPEGAPRWMDPPLRLANLKAKVLKGRLRSRMRQPDAAPRVEPLIFLSHPDTVLDLSSEGRVGVVTRRDVVEAITRHKFPGAPSSWRADPIDKPRAKDIAQALEALGVRKRKGKMFAGGYELGELLDDGILQLEAAGDARPAPSGYQDRAATHRDAKTMTCRARVYLVPQQTTVERRQLLMRAADREAQLLHSVREHKNILRMNDYVTDAPLGPTLLFDAFEGAVPLDTYLRQNPNLSFADQIEIVEQIAQALAYCHKKEVVHGALGPHAVLVRPDPEGVGALQTKLFNFQLGAGKAVRTTVHWSALASDPWALYQAPELREEAVRAPSPASDIFSLGALAHLVFSRRAPAGSVLELDARLARTGHLDVKEVADCIADPVREAIALATERVVSLRADDAGQWINLLLEALTKADEPVVAPARDPLEAKKNDVIGGDLTVEGRLGYGSTSVVLRVNRASDGRSYALKVSQAAEHDERLVEEAKVLGLLEQHPRIVRLVDVRVIADRTCLLLTLAGEQTLQKFLAQEGTISLDYASRFGEDLLSALEELEARRVVHRDIKPANVGVGSVTKQEKRLTLFDFSLGLAPLTELDVGTAVYRDPYLRARGAWDPAADRWSAAVTLHEALTGVRPTSPDAVSAGDLTAKVVVAAERLDPGVRDKLSRFFDKAFAPDVELRFGAAREMQRAWTAAFDAPGVITIPPPEVAATSGDAPAPAALSDAAFSALRVDTPVEALPLSVRARNALDRAGVLTASGVFELPDNRLSSVRGVGRLVAKEIAEFRAKWASTHAGAAAQATPFFAGGYPGDDVRIDTTNLEPAIVAALADAGIDSFAALAAAPLAHVEVLARRAEFDAAKLTNLLERGAKEAGDRELPLTVEAWIEALLPRPKRRAPYLLELYGLVPPFEGRVDLSVRQLAEHHRVTTANVYQVLSDHRAAWAKHGAMLQLRDLAHAVVDEAGGALPLPRAGDAMCARLPHDRSASPELRAARGAALVRVVAEVERDAATALRLVRLARGGPWVATSDAAVPVLDKLGAAADELASLEVLASAGEATRRLSDIAQETPFAALPPERLAEIAAAASATAARSPRLEIYPRGLSPARALALSSSALVPPQGPAGPQGFTPEELAKRVASRYPDAAPLPLRPALDVLLEPHQLVWVEGEGKYTRLGHSHPTTGSSTSYVPLHHQKTATGDQARAKDPRALTARSFDEKVAHAIERRLLRVVGVRADRARDAALMLAKRAGVAPVSLDREIVAQMKALMRENDIDEAVVHATDDDGPASPGWSNLVELARRAAERVAEKILPPRRPLVLAQPGLLARYKLDAFVQAVVDASKQRDAAAIFVVVPAHDGVGLPLVNGTLPIRGVLATDALWVSIDWLENWHNSAA